MSKDTGIDYGNGMYYCERYYESGRLSWKGVIVNDKLFGYYEFYNSGVVSKISTGYYLYDKKVSVDNENGYCLIWSKVEL